MASPQSNEFETEVVFPDNPYDAARMYFAVMAYPELGAGQPGGSGSEFTDILGKFQLWATKRAKGQAFLRSALGDQGFKAPQLREFRGGLERGRRRIFRRFAAYDVIGTQMINGFFRLAALTQTLVAEGRGEEAFHLTADGKVGVPQAHLWKQAIPSPQETISSSLERWSDKFALNLTGKSADRQQKVKDLKRRAFDSSLPVLHMTHGVNHLAYKVSGHINGWNERDPILGLLLNAELWIWDAIDAAESWRLIADYVPGIDFLAANQMIQLKRS